MTRFGNMGAEVLQWDFCKVHIALNKANLTKEFACQRIRKDTAVKSNWVLQEK